MNRHEIINNITPVDRSRLRLQKAKDKFKNNALNSYINAPNNTEQQLIAGQIIEHRKLSEVSPVRDIELQKLKPQHKSDIPANSITGDKTFNSGIFAKSEILIEAEKRKTRGKEISAKKRHLSFIEGQTGKNIAKGFFNMLTFGLPYVCLRLYSYLWGDRAVEKNVAKEIEYYSASEDRCRNFCHNIDQIDKRLSPQAPRIISTLTKYFPNQSPEPVENKNAVISDPKKIPLPERLYGGLYGTLDTIINTHHESIGLDHFYTITDGDFEFCVKFMKDDEGYSYSIYVDDYFSKNTPEEIKARCAYVEEQRNILSKDDYSSTLMQALIKFNRELYTNPKSIELDHFYTIMEDGPCEVCIKVTKNGGNHDFSIYATDRYGQLSEIRKYYAMNLLLAEFAGIKALDKITSIKVDLDREVLLKTVLSELLSADKLETADKMLSELLGSTYKRSISQETQNILQFQQQITEGIEKAYTSIEKFTLSFLSKAISLGENASISGAQLEDYSQKFLEPLEQHVSKALSKIDLKNGVLSKDSEERIGAIKDSIAEYFNKSLQATFHIAPENLLAFKETFQGKIDEIVKQYSQIILLKIHSTNEAIKEVLTEEKNKLRKNAEALLTKPKYSVPLPLIAQQYIFAVIKINSPKLLGFMISYLNKLSDKAKQGRKLSPLEKTSALKVLSFIRDYYNYKEFLDHPLFPINDFSQEREHKIEGAKGPVLMKIEDKDLDKIFSYLRPEDLERLNNLHYTQKEHLSSDDNLSLLPLLLGRVIPIIDPDTKEENSMLKQYFELSSLLSIEEIRDISPILTSAERMTGFGYFISEILEGLVSTAESIKYSNR